MSDRPRAVTQQTSVREAAQLMEQEDVGSLPVVDESTRLVGIVTDRDIAVRVVAQGADPETQVGQIASTDVLALTPEHDLDEALKLMAREQVRRLPIVAGENQLVGIVAQADVARMTKGKHSGEVLEAISEPPRGPRVAGPDSGSDVRVGDEERSDRYEERSDR
jgi:signal-transduction protein with cAMP-binding, CBS, and nucleotidyltransferase domain